MKPDWPSRWRTFTHSPAGGSATDRMFQVFGDLIQFADQARLSRELVTLKPDVPVEVPHTDHLPRMAIGQRNLVPAPR